MLAERALKIANDIYLEIGQSKILQMLVTAAQYAQTRGQPTYQNSIDQIIQQCDSIIGQSTFHVYPPELLAFVESKDFGSLLPLNVARRIKQGFSGNQNTHLLSTEIMALHQSLSQLNSNIVGFIAFCTQLDIRLGSIAVGHVSIDLEMPREVFDGRFDHLLASYKHFDRLFQVAGEISGAGRNSPTVYRASSSTLTMALLFVQDHYLTIVSVYGALLTAANKTLGFYKTISDLKAAKVAPEAIKAVEDQREVATKGFVNDAIEASLADLAAKGDIGRPNELKNELSIVSQDVVIDLVNGSRIHLSIENFSGKNLDALILDGGSRDNLVARLQELRLIENAIDQSRRNGTDEVKLITSDRKDDAPSEGSATTPPIVKE